MAFHVLINANSGTAQRLGADQMTAMINNSGIDCASVSIMKPEDLDAHMHELVARNDQNPILIGGGDGTIAKTAALHLKAEKPFGILPCGTMNMLAQDLEIPLDFAEALKAYSHTKTIHIDVGFAHDIPFLCCAAFGTMPEAAKMREEGRELPAMILLPRLTAYIYQRLDVTQRRHVRLTMDNRFRKIKTGMLVISNNRYDASLGSGSFKKEDLQDGVLGVYSVSPKGLKEKFRLFIRMKTGAWQKDPAVTSDQARKIVLNTNRKEELISIDGEPLTMRTPVEFHIRPRALSVIVPDKNEP